MDQARTLDDQAQQALQEQQWEVSRDLWEKAAVQCKSYGRYRDAAGYLSKAADAALNLGGNRTEALRLYGESAALLEKLQNFNSLARVQSIMGELLEQEAKFEEASEAWQKRAEYLLKENGSAVTADQALTKSADAIALAGNYVRAVKIYESIAFPQLDHPHRKYAANELLFRALLCHIAQAASTANLQDSPFDAVESVFDMYRDESIDMAHLPECSFFCKAIAALKSNDIAEFVTVAKEYGKSIKLSRWKVLMLCEIQRLCSIKSL